MEARSYASLSGIARRLEALLEPARSAPPFWVRAELSSANERRGRLYCDLVETRDGQVIAKLRCHVWNSDLAAIRRRFERCGLPLVLDDGTEVGIKCKVEFHPVYGLSLRGVDMDPEIALGALERRRREILERLAADRLLDQNRARRLPLVPTRIGLVASAGTAGYHDFVTTLSRCSVGVEILFADAQVQGDDTERSVCRALDRLAALDVDLVVLVRGGGSRIDLSYLDNEAIARKIAGFPVPVWTGIGHETDRSVVDEVAARSFKTPTAVAEGIADLLHEFERWLDGAAQRLEIACRLRIDPERRRLGHAARMIRSAAMARVKLASQVLAERDKSLAKTVGRLLERRRGALATAEATLRRSTGYLLRAERSALAGYRARFRLERYQQRLARAAERHTEWARALRGADPARVLARGYSLTYAEDGKLLQSVATLVPGARIRTRLADGVIASQVESIEESE